jgi:hypothetical protein
MYSHLELKKCETNSTYDSEFQTINTPLKFEIAQNPLLYLSFVFEQVNYYVRESFGTYGRHPIQFRLVQFQLEWIPLRFLIDGSLVGTLDTNLLISFAIMNSPAQKMTVCQFLFFPGAMYLVHQVVS